MFSASFNITLETAYREATNRKHAYFCIEHLLFSLLEDKEVQDVIMHCGGRLKELKLDLESFFKKYVEEVDDSEHYPGLSETEIGPIQTPAIQRVLQRAVFHMHSAGKEMVTGKDVLVQIFSEKDSHAAFYLRKQDISEIDVIQYLSHGIAKVDIDESDVDDPTDLDDGAHPARTRKKKKILEALTENLSKQATQGLLDPIIGREKELERLIKILCRRQKNNPLLLGEPGVGKTAMASALAQKIARGDVPEVLQDAKVYSLNVGSLVAGTKFRGEFEDRLKKLVKELSRLPNPILFIDEIHTIVGAGATGTGSMDAANLLKPMLSNGKIRCVGSTTHEDFKKHFEKDRALTRRFSTIDLTEPDIDETVEILTGLKDRFEEHHKVTFTKSALRAAAELSSKHITDRFLPDKAIDVLDEAGATNAIRPAAKRKKNVTDKDIEEVVSAIARVPVNAVNSRDEKTLRHLEDKLQTFVFGQNDAVIAVSRAIKRSRANLKGDDKPVGCFLFAGPTGVGKTELARALSTVLGVPFHRFDMSEYMEKHAVARLIGAPPGYVGYEEGGILTDLVRRQPYAVLLLDEIEKAHEDIYNILLQVMDDASLTDSHGKRADFRNIILIMTTNAGSEKAAGLGFGNHSSSSNRDTAIKKLFKPEFRNRLDDIIYFAGLPVDVIRKVAQKFIVELEEQLKTRKVTLTVAEPVFDYLAANGYDPVLGARPMKRLIQTKIKDTLADELLFGKLATGGTLHVTLKDDTLHFAYN